MFSFSSENEHIILKLLFTDKYLSVCQKSFVVLDTKGNKKLNQPKFLTSECLKDH